MDPVSPLMIDTGCVMAAHREVLLLALAAARRFITQAIRTCFRHGAAIALPRNRRHAGLHRRPFYHGTLSCGRSSKAGQSANSDSDALRNLSDFDRNT